MNNVVALDVGEQRVGVAFAHADVRVPVALTTLKRQDSRFWQNLTDVIAEHEVTHIVIGLPRSLDGNETAQTKTVQSFASELLEHIDATITWQDEALTSIKAENVLRNHGKPYAKSDIDAMAASFILADYLETESLVR